MLLYIANTWYQQDGDTDRKSRFKTMAVFPKMPWHRFCSEDAHIALVIFFESIFVTRHSRKPREAIFLVMFSQDFFQYLLYEYDPDLFISQWLVISPLLLSQISPLISANRNLNKFK